MAGKDIIIMSMKELRRIPVIHSIINKHITQKEAASILGISRRQVIRITVKVKRQGDIAFIHKARGAPSHRARPRDQKNKILGLCKTRYKDFGPTFASEKLLEIDKIDIHPDTLRKWFIDNSIEYKKRKLRKHRSWRPRKAHYGEMIQMDGSHHPWLEQRGPECVLMGYIDDATGRIYGRFYEYEGTMPAMDSFKRYIKRYGIPQSIYLDKHSTYKSTKSPTLEDEFNNIKNLSQFERALKEFGIDVIHANSPQAKGRIERSFNTHQDRLVKELRLANISTIEEANALLGAYIGKHNARFSVKAKNKANLHRLAPSNLNVSRMLSIKNKATLKNDFTIQNKNRFYQILDTIRAKEITIEEHLDGKIYLYHNNTRLRYKLIDKMPKQNTKKTYKLSRSHKPAGNHPWREFKQRIA